MAWIKALGASLALAAALGCSGAPGDDEDIPFYLTENQMKAAIVSDAKWKGLLESAQKENPETPVMYVDITKRVCKKHEDPAPLHMFVLHNPSSDYVPENRYTEVAYYCMQDYMWYYRYISADKKTDVILGPYFVARQPQGGGAEYQRGGPKQHE